MKRFLKSISILLFVLTFSLLVGCESVELPSGEKENLGNGDLENEIVSSGTTDLPLVEIFALLNYVLIHQMTYCIFPSEKLSCLL